MSTRAYIATKRNISNTDKINDFRWRGVYNHFDGYPDGLGKAIWDRVQEYAAGGRKMTDVLNAFVDIEINGHTSGWSSFASRVCYCHDPYFVMRDGVNHKKATDTNKDIDPLFIEWVYIIDPKKESMDVLKSIEKDGKYIHVYIKTIEFTEKEPNWKELNEMTG